MMFQSRVILKFKVRIFFFQFPFLPDESVIRIKTERLQSEKNQELLSQDSKYVNLKKGFINR